MLWPESICEDEEEELCVCDTARIWEEEVQKLAPLVVQPVLYLQICLVLCNISDIILICSFL